MSSRANKAVEPDVLEAVERAAAGERVVLTRGGAQLAAVVPLEDLRRLEDEAPEDRPNGSESNGLDLFIAMAGEVRSGEHDVSADKYRHLGDAYATKP